MINTITENKMLTNVVVIRPSLLILLVFYHAFAIYSGRWEPIDGFHEIPVYYWLDKLSYAFMLEMFVFVSGYVFGYQVRTKGEWKLLAKNLLVSKFKRLLVPSMFFSLMYVIIFYDVQSQNVIKTIYDVVAGTAHMWFLPMLFWCFIFVYIIEHLHLLSNYFIPILMLFSVLPQLPIPFYLSHSLYYMFFFYTGYFIQRKNIDLTKLYNLKNLIGLSISFLILFIILSIVEKRADIFIDETTLVSKALKILVFNSCKFIYSTVGIIMILCAIGVYQRKHSENIPKWIASIGELCMGVYIFQQFILKYLYYYTSLPSFFDPYSLPWVGFVLTLSISLLSAWILHKNKWGRLLIG